MTKMAKLAVRQKNDLTICAKCCHCLFKAAIPRRVPGPANHEFGTLQQGSLSPLQGVQSVTGLAKGRLRAVHQLQDRAGLMLSP